MNLKRTGNRAMVFLFSVLLGTAGLLWPLSATALESDDRVPDWGVERLGPWGEAVDARLSQNGRYILLAVYGNGAMPDGKTNMPGLFVYDLAESSARRLVNMPTNHSLLACGVSVEGRYVAYAAEGAFDLRPTVHLVDLHKETSQTIPAPEGVIQIDRCSMTPSGRHISFDGVGGTWTAERTYKPGTSHVFVYDHATQGILNVDSAPAGEQGDGSSFGLVLSASGEWAAFTSFATNLTDPLTPKTLGFPPPVFLRNLKSGVIRLVSNGGSQSSLSPNGRYIAYRISRNALMLLDLETGAVRGIPAVRYPSAEIGNAVVSSDGKQVAYSFASQNSQGDWSHLSFVYDVNTEAVKELKGTDSVEMSEFGRTLIARVVRSIDQYTAYRNELLVLSHASSQLEFEVDGHPVSMGYVIDEGRVLVKLQDLIEALRTGYSIVPDQPSLVWLNKSREAAISGRTVYEDGIGYTYQVRLKPSAEDGDGRVGSPIMSVSRDYKPWANFRLDVPPRVLGGHTYLPLRAITDAIGYRTSFVRSANLVSISTREEPIPVDLERLNAFPPTIDGGVWVPHKEPVQGWPMLPATLEAYERAVRAANLLAYPKYVKAPLNFTVDDKNLRWINNSSKDEVLLISGGHLVRTLTIEEATLLKYALEDREAKRGAWWDLFKEVVSLEPKVAKYVGSIDAAEKLLSHYISGLSSQQLSRCIDLAQKKDYPPGSPTSRPKVYLVFHNWRFDGSYYTTDSKCE